MFPPPGRGPRPETCGTRLLVSEAGILGVFLMLACHRRWVPVLNGRKIWVVPNLFRQSIFFGRSVYQKRLCRFRHLVRRRHPDRHLRRTGFALGFSLEGEPPAGPDRLRRHHRRGGLLPVLPNFIWIHLEPAIALYAPDGQFELGHLLWGMALAKSPVFARRIADQTAEPVVVEVGEVIR